MTYVAVAGSAFFYLCGAVFTFCRVCSAQAWGEAERYPHLRGKPDWGEGVFLGVLNAPFWPVTLPVWLCVWKNKRGRHGVVSGFLFRPPPHLRQYAQEALTREREEYIKRLEREAGIV